MKHLRLLDKKLTCDGPDGMRITQTILPQLCVLDRDTSSLESAAAGGWSIETGGSPGARLAVDCRRTRGRRSQWETLVKESRADAETGRYR